jgi:hypothetical protein
MFYRVLPKIKQFYPVPVVFMSFGKGFSGGYEEYVKNMNDNNVTLAHHTFCCIMGTYMGVLSGAFLGITWPISLPIFIGRYLDNNNKK